MPAKNPTFPANAGIQIHSGRLRWVRLIAQPSEKALVVSIWAPAFAGEIGEVRRCG